MGLGVIIVISGIAKVCILILKIIGTNSKIVGFLSK